MILGCILLTSYFYSRRDCNQQTRKYDSNRSMVAWPWHQVHLPSIWLFLYFDFEVCSLQLSALYRSCDVDLICLALTNGLLHSTCLLPSMSLSWFLYFVVFDSVCYYQRKNMESTLHGKRCQSSRSSRSTLRNPFPLSLPKLTSTHNLAHNLLTGCH